MPKLNLLLGQTPGSPPPLYTVVVMELTEISLIGNLVTKTIKFRISLIYLGNKT